MWHPENDTLTAITKHRPKRPAFEAALRWPQASREQRLFVAALSREATQRPDLVDARIALTERLVRRGEEAQAAMRQLAQISGVPISKLLGRAGLKETQALKDGAAAARLALSANAPDYVRQYSDAPDARPSHDVVAELAQHPLDGSLISIPTIDQPYDTEPERLRAAQSALQNNTPLSVPLRGPAREALCKAIETLAHLEPERLDAKVAVTEHYLATDGVTRPGTVKMAIEGLQLATSALKDAGYQRQWAAGTLPKQEILERLLGTQKSSAKDGSLILSKSARPEAAPIDPNAPVHLAMLSPNHLAAVGPHGAGYQKGSIGLPIRLIVENGQGILQTLRGNGAVSNHPVIGLSSKEFALIQEKISPTGQLLLDEGPVWRPSLASNAPGDGRWAIAYQLTAPDTTATIQADAPKTKVKAEQPTSCQAQSGRQRLSRAAA